MHAFWAPSVVFKTVTTASRCTMAGLSEKTFFCLFSLQNNALSKRYDERKEFPFLCKKFWHGKFARIGHFFAWKQQQQKIEYQLKQCSIESLPKRTNFKEFNLFFWKAYGQNYSETCIQDLYRHAATLLIRPHTTYIDKWTKNVIRFTHKTARFWLAKMTNH